jgi:hypothetical protein
MKPEAFRSLTKVEGNEVEEYTVSNGETWMNNTNPLYFNDYKKLPLQKMSVGRILDMSRSSEQFRLNVRKYTGYEITSYEAEEIYKSYLDLHKNIRIK